MLLAMLLFLCSNFVEGLNYYELLQVDRGASNSDIKRAYRSIALKYHPDKGGASENAIRTEFMKEVNSARDTLSDSRERATYDMYLGPWYYNPGGSNSQGDPFQNWLMSRRQASQRQRQNEKQQRQAEEWRRREFENRQRQDAERRRQAEEEAKRYAEQLRDPDRFQKMAEQRRQEMERKRRQEEERKRQEEERQRQAEERRRSEFIERQRQEAEQRRQAEEAKKQHAEQIERELEQMRKETQQRKEESKRRVRETKEAAERYVEQLRKETERQRQEAELRENEAAERQREAQERQEQEEYEYDLRQAEARREEFERKNKRNFIAAVSTGAAGTAAAVVGGILYFRHRASQKRCNTCMKTSATGVSSVDNACSNSISSCKSYYFKLANHCREKCSSQQVMQPMNLYLHKILQNQSEPMFQLIQNATSIEELRPAVTFFHQLKDMERKTSTNSRFGKSLSAKVEQAIEAKEDMINGVAPPSAAGMILRVALKSVLVVIDLIAAATTN